MKTFTLGFAAALILALSLPARAQDQVKQEVIALEGRPGVTIKYLAVTAGAKPEAAVILFPGGNGVLKLQPNGAMGDLRLNFLIRARADFARQGLYVAGLDAPSEREAGMNGQYRLSREHAMEIASVIADVKQRSGAKVWLVGTSAGTLSAAGAAARLFSQERLPRPDGLVLTSTMTQLDGAGHCGKSVYDASLNAITAPVLVVSHRDDGCACSPGIPEIGVTLLARLTASTVKEHKVFTGGDAPKSGPCDARSQHGYFGIEADVVKTIADWIKSH